MKFLPKKGSLVKTLRTLLLLMALPVCGADVPSKPAPAAPTTNTTPAAEQNEDALRAALEKAYSAESANKKVTNATTGTASNAAVAPGTLGTSGAPSPRQISPAQTPPLTSAVPPVWTIRSGTNPPAYRAVTNVLAALTNATGAASNLANALTNIVAAATNLAAAATNRARTIPAPPGFAAPQVPTPSRTPGSPATAPQTVTVGPGAGASTNTLGLPPAGMSDPNQEILPAGLIKFNEADLSQVLEIYQELTGRTVLKPTSLSPAKISIRTQTPLTRAEAVQALDSILSMNGITMVPQGEKFVKAIQEAQAGQAAQQFNSIDPNKLPEAGSFVTQVIQLTNASPNDLLPVLQPFAKFQQSILTIPSVNMLVLRDYAENVKRMVEMIKKVDVIPQQEFESVVIPIKYALAGDIAQVLGSLTSGGGSTTTVGGQQGGGGIGGGLSGAGGFGRSGAGGYGQGGYGARGYGGGGYGGYGGYGGVSTFSQQATGLQAAQSDGGATFTPQATGVQGVQTGTGGQTAQRGSFQQRLQQIVNKAATGGAGEFYVLGSTKIIADERTNALLIFASKQDLATVSNIIAKLDVVLAQVLIESIIMEVTLGNNLDYGFSYLQTKPTTIGDFLGLGAINNVPFLRNSDFVSTNAGALPGGFTYVASFMGLDAVVRAIAGDNRARILQRPRIQTSHAVPADLFVGQTRPYPTTSYYGGGAFGGYSSIQQLQIGVTLSVLPLINPDGLVVMDIRQRIQAYDGDVEIQNVGKVPITSEKEASAKVAVRDGETIILGGFISNSKNKTASGVPILKDIPVLGALFRSTSENDQRSELVVLIRPTVLPTPLDAARFADEERARMPATRQFESDVKDSEQKMLNEKPQPKGPKPIFN
jgi:general secretion pathway protein D